MSQHNTFFFHFIFIQNIEYKNKIELVFKYFHDRLYTHNAFIHTFTHFSLLGVGRWCYKLDFNLWHVRLGFLFFDAGYHWAVDTLLWILTFIIWNKMSYLQRKYNENSYSFGNKQEGQLRVEKYKECIKNVEIRSLVRIVMYWMSATTSWNMFMKPFVCV